MKKVLSVRIENDLYTKVYKCKQKKSDIVSKALQYYFNSNGSNNIINDSEYISFLKQSLNEKNDYIGFLQKEIENLTVMNMAKIPLLARIKMKLLGEKPE